jgi:hypothetical protein
MPVWGIEPLLQAGSHQKNTHPGRGVGGKLRGPGFGVTHQDKIWKFSIKQDVPI